MSPPIPYTHINKGLYTTINSIPSTLPCAPGHRPAQNKEQGTRNKEHRTHLKKKKNIGLIVLSCFTYVIYVCLFVFFVAIVVIIILYIQAASRLALAPSPYLLNSRWRNLRQLLRSLLSNALLGPVDNVIHNLPRRISLLHPIVDYPS